MNLFPCRRLLLFTVLEEHLIAENPDAGKPVIKKIFHLQLQLHHRYFQYTTADKLKVGSAKTHQDICDKI